MFLTPNNQILINKTKTEFVCKGFIHLKEEGRLSIMNLTENILHIVKDVDRKNSLGLCIELGSGFDIFQSDLLKLRNKLISRNI